eukprot:g83051.t1
MLTSIQVLLGHPDHEDNSKFRLLLEGVERLCKRIAPTLPLENVFLWVDYCINQDSAPASELDNLTGIVHECDVLFTPLTGDCKGYLKTSGADSIMAYHNAVWRPLGDHGDGSSYVERGWTRAEMFLGSTQELRPGATGELKPHLNLALLAAIGQDRRAHFLYSQYESNGLMSPFLLPPLQNSYFEKYNPATGKLTKEEDRQVIQRLVYKLRPRVKMLREGYEGQRNAAGQAHGFGKNTYANGDVYEGEWQAGKMHGTGKYTFASGDVYEGEWQANQKHGKGKYTYANGGVYEGEWQADKMHAQASTPTPAGLCTRVSGRPTRSTAQASTPTPAGLCTRVSGRPTRCTAQASAPTPTGMCTRVSGRPTRSTAQASIRTPAYVYKGDYQADQKHGKGKFTYAGNLYEGEWQAGQKHGKGKMIYPDGEIVYDGMWFNDQPPGSTGSSSGSLEYVAKVLAKLAIVSLCPISYFVAGLFALFVAAMRLSLCILSGGITCLEPEHHYISGFGRAIRSAISGNSVSQEFCVTLRPVQVLKMHKILFLSRANANAQSDSETSRDNPTKIAEINRSDFAEVVVEDQPKVSMTSTGAEDAAPDGPNQPVIKTSRSYFCG